MNTYQDCLDYLYSTLPMFTRIGKAAYKADLTNTNRLMEILEHPEQKNKFIHIAGTNGKGSVSHTLASILQCAGYKVGLFTSPHLKDFRERIKINGELIPESYIIQFINQYKKEFEPISPSFFEWTVALCFKYFSENNPDIIVIETGLGGRLDSTNVINPLLSIITNISYDHTDLLGDTLSAIAMEKSGIIKTDIPCIVGRADLETTAVFYEKSRQTNAPLIWAEEQFTVVEYTYSGRTSTLTVQSPEKKSEKFICGLPGVYQKENMVTVLAAIEQLNNLRLNIPKSAVKEGMERVTELTGLRGRWETISEQPNIIADTGHNEAGIKKIIEQLTYINYNKLHWVYGTVNDKSIDKVLNSLPRDAEYYWCAANMPRALSPQILNEQAQQIGLRGSVYQSVQAALEGAKSAAKSEDLILVCGSTFIVAEII